MHLNISSVIKRPFCRYNPEYNPETATMSFSTYSATPINTPAKKLHLNTGSDPQLVKTFEIYFWMPRSDWKELNTIEHDVAICSNIWCLLISPRILWYHDNIWLVIDTGLTLNRRRNQRSVNVLSLYFIYVRQYPFTHPYSYPHAKHTHIYNVYKYMQREGEGEGEGEGGERSGERDRVRDRQRETDRQAESVCFFLFIPMIDGWWLRSIAGGRVSFFPEKKSYITT